MERYQFLCKAVSSGGKLFSWATGNLDPNISDISKLYFLVIFKGRKKIVFGHPYFRHGAFTYINSTHLNYTHGNEIQVIPSAPGN